MGKQDVVLWRREALAIVICGRKGSAEWDTRCSLMLVQLPETMEACAFKEGVKLTITDGWNHVIIVDNYYKVIQRGNWTTRLLRAI
ncbi:hypothetical protein V6N11_033480 [Hibiscus sabdariffa]|uniref:Uncharacterized protein n=1 Tax=Hibiscus sabdariffa TaxID=183260 RepID=A0ABR2PYN1_9ROSI